MARVRTRGNLSYTSAKEAGNQPTKEVIVRVYWEETATQDKIDDLRGVARLASHMTLNGEEVLWMPNDVMVMAYKMAKLIQVREFYNLTKNDINELRRYAQKTD